MNASFFVPFGAKLRQSEICSVLLMSDVSSKMIPYHPLARTSFVIVQCSTVQCQKNKKIVVYQLMIPFTNDQKLVTC